MNPEIKTQLAEMIKEIINEQANPEPKLSEKEALAKENAALKAQVKAYNLGLTPEEFEAKSKYINFDSIETKEDYDTIFGGATKTEEPEQTPEPSIADLFGAPSTPSAANPENTDLDLEIARVLDYKGEK